jgi:hypothetical protein
MREQAVAFEMWQRIEDVVLMRFRFDVHLLGV